MGVNLDAPKNPEMTQNGLNPSSIPPQNAEINNMNQNSVTIPKLEFLQNQEIVQSSNNIAPNPNLNTNIIMDGNQPHVPQKEL